MPESTAVMRVKIAGRWTVADFRTSLACLEGLYNLLFEVQDYHGDFKNFRNALRHRLYLHPDETDYLFEYLINYQTDVNEPAHSFPLLPEEQLVLKEIVYASPGHKDLGGIGECIRALCDLVKHLVDLYATRTERKLSNDKQRLQNENQNLKNQQLRIDITKKFLGIFDTVGISKRKQREFVSRTLNQQEPLIRMIIDRQITDVEMIETILPINGDKQ